MRKSQQRVAEAEAQGQFMNPNEEEHPPLEAITRSLECVCNSGLSSVVMSYMLKESNKPNFHSKPYL